MKENEGACTEPEEPPGHGRPPHPRKDVPLAQWNDRRWQLSHRLNTVDDFVQVIHLIPEEVEGLSAPGLFCVDVTHPGNFELWRESNEWMACGPDL